MIKVYLKNQQQPKTIRPTNADIVQTIPLTNQVQIKSHGKPNFMSTMSPQAVYNRGYHKFKTQEINFGGPQQ
jgi:hypothetical protein